jgi:exodeoxyribonuclease-3
VIRKSAWSDIRLEQGRFGEIRPIYGLWKDQAVRIATWNINSVTSRLEHLLGWLETASPDVVCLQELKCATDAFPTDALSKAGYEVAAHGDGRWNGVAIVSRVGIADVVRDLPGQPDFEGSIEPRAIGATCGGVRVWSLYVPNGREPGHTHFTYKLEWLKQLSTTAATELERLSSTPLAFLGDYNVAPTDDDVYDIAAFEGSTHVTAEERAALTDLESLGLIEVVPRPLKYDVAFTFWDYRQLGFPKNRGMRIDLAYANESFTRAVTDAYVDRDARKGKTASDHAPVVFDLNLDLNLDPNV